MSKGTLEIHSQNILPIIKQWLYTDKDIFIRELVSNSCDAIGKRIALSGQSDLPSFEDKPQISITLDEASHTLTFSDNGIGMNEEEIVKYLSQVAFSSAEDFISKYKQQEEGQEIIGHFGLGFYSAFMVADKVTVHSKSADGKSSGVTWSCDGGIEYDLEPCEKETAGTDIVLSLSSEHQDYLKKSKIKEILNRYCRFVRYDLYFGEEQINPKEHLWEKKPSEIKDEEYLEFYRYLYPSHPDPMFWIHLDVDYPFHLKGILYFPKIDNTWQSKSQALQLYSQRVFVSDDCKDILPEYLSALHGAFDSSDIPLNVSRSSLQRDTTVRQLSGHICKKVADKLKNLFKNNREKFEEVWPQIEAIVKYGIHEDSKFYDRTHNIMIWKTLDDQFKTIEELALSSKKDESPKRVYYIFPEQRHSQMTKLYKDQGVQVILANPIIDPPTMSLIESKNKDVTFCRCDGKLDEQMIDASKEDTLIDSDGKTQSAKLAEFVKGSLECEVQVKSLHDNQLPGIVILDESQRRMRDWFERQQPQSPMANLNLQSGCFIINSNHSIIKTIDKLREKKPELAKDMIKEVYDLSLLSQGELSDEERAKMVEKSFDLMAKLSESITQ